MPSRITNITIDCADLDRAIAFWTAALGYEVADDVTGISIRDPAGVGLPIGFQPVPEPKVVKNRLHLDLTPTDGDWEAEVARLEALGAERVHFHDHDPAQTWWIMRDPDGNEFCLVRFNTANHP